MTDPDGNTTCYTYDGDGNTTSITNPLGNTWSYSYNSFDERTLRDAAARGGSVLVALAALGDQRRRDDDAARLSAAQVRHLQPVRHKRRPGMDHDG